MARTQARPQTIRLGFNGANVNEHFRQYACRERGGTALATDGVVQSTVLPIENEPAPRLIVDPPLPGPLAQGIAFIPYRLENVRILPVGGPAARDVSPRIGHLHITVDDLPWQWADFGESNTVVLIGMPRGQHKVLIEVVDPEGKVFIGQTVTFEAPGKQSP